MDMVDQGASGLAQGRLLITPIAHFLGLQEKGSSLIALGNLVSQSEGRASRAQTRRPLIGLGIY